MAHDNNGRIYIDPNGTGVEIADLQQVLRRGVSDLGLLCGDVEWDDTQTPAVLVPANKVNPWAKYKPIRSDKLGILTDSERELENYGLSIPSSGFSSINAMIAGLSNSDWTYLPPRGKGNGSGGSDEWFRIRDFEGYNQNADAPIYPIAEVTDLTSSESSMDAGLGFGRNIASQSGYLTLDDLRVDGHSVSDPFGEYYFGIALYYSDTVRYATTMSNKYGTIAPSLSEIGLSVVGVSVPGSGSRIYRAVPFFASIPFTSMPSNYAGSLYPLPFAECQLRITRIQDVWCSVLMYTLMGSETPLYYQYRIVNPTNSQRTFTVNVWALQSYNINDHYGAFVRQDAGVVVPAQDSVTSTLYTLTDGIRVRDILANAPFVGLECKVGDVLEASSISSVIVDADPLDPPSF